MVRPRPGPGQPPTTGLSSSYHSRSRLSIGHHHHHGDTPDTLFIAALVTSSSHIYITLEKSSSKQYQVSVTCPFTAVWRKDLTRGRSCLETLYFLCRGFVILKPSFQYYVYCVFWWICMYLTGIRAWCVRGWVREAWCDVENVAGIKNKNSFSISLRL